MLIPWMKPTVITVDSEISGVHRVICVQRVGADDEADADQQARADLPMTRPQISAATISPAPRGASAMPAVTTG